MSNYSEVLVKAESEEAVKADAGGVAKRAFWGSLVGTRASSAQLVARLGLAVVIWPHGAQKLLGWFGGYGFEGTMGYLTQSLPSPVALLVILGEFFGPILLAAGFLTRFAAASIAAIMIGAITMVHLPNGFFMNWEGTLPGEGYEFHLLALSLAIALVIRGAGSASVDLKLSRAKD